MSDFNVEFSLDTSQFAARLAQLQQAVPAMGVRTLHQFAEDALHDVQQNHMNALPSGNYITGELRDSGYVKDEQIGFNTVAVEIGFTAPYALWVHEGHHLIFFGHDTGIDIPPTKFLEAPLLEHTSRFAEEGGRLFAADLEGFFR